MPQPSPSAFHEAAEAAVAFAAAVPWLVFRSDQLIALRFEGEEEPWFASVLGAGGEEFGLALYRGGVGLRFVRRALAASAMDDDLFEPVAYCGFGLHEFAELSRDERRALERAGLRLGRHDPAPALLAKAPGRVPGPPGDEQSRRIARAARAIVSALAAGDLGPAEEGDDALPTLVVPRDAAASPPPPARERFEESAPAAPRPLPVPRDLGHHDAGATRWLAGLPTINARIQGDDRSVRAFLLVDEASGKVLDFDAQQRDAARAAGKRLLAKIAEHAAEHDELPGEVVVAGETLHALVAPALAKLGVRCRYEPAVPGLDRVVRKLGDALAGG